MASKKMKKQLMDKMSNVIDTAEKLVLQDMTGLSGGTEKSLEALKTQYETVKVKIKKRNKEGKMAAFVDLDGQAPAALEEVGLDSLCMAEGGGGDYEAWIQAPGKPPVKFWAGSVMGVSYDVPRSQREAGAGGNPFGNLFGGGNQPVPTGAPNTFHVPNLQQYVGGTIDTITKQSQDSTDRMLAMMMQQQQQQQQASQQMMMMQQQAAQQQMQMMGMMFNHEKTDGPSDSERELREQLKRMEDERRRDREREEDRRREEERRRMEDQRREDERRWQQMQQQVADQKNSQMVELMKLANRGDKDTGTLIASIFSNNQQMAQQQQMQYTALLEKIMSQPSETEKIGELTNVMLNSQMAQMNLISQGMQAGLFGGGGESKHPILDAVKEGIRALREMREGAAAGYDPGMMQEMPEPGQMAPPAYVEQPQHPQLPQDGSMGGPQAWDAPRVGGNQQQQQQIDPEAVVTEDDLERLEKDRALVPVAAAIMNGDDPVEIPLRLYNYALHGGSKFAAKWLEYPVEVTSQICNYLDVPQQRAQQVLDVIIAFIRYVTPADQGGQGKAPEEWPEGYVTEQGARPDPKPVAQAQSASTSYAGAGPEVGVSKQAPVVQGEEYDPSKLPEGVSQEDAQRLEEEAARTALEYAKKEEEEAAAAPPVDPAAQPSKANDKPHPKKVKKTKKAS